MIERNKKGQLEIIGLVFIVIIVSVAILFYLSYSINNGGNKRLLKEYGDNELGTSFASTFLKTSICGVEMDDLLVDCAFKRQLRCSGNKDSCETINDTMLYLLSETMDLWDEAYGITIRYSQSADPEYVENGFSYDGFNTYYFDAEKWVYARNNCTEETTGRRAPGLFLIPISRTGDSVSIEVGLCKQ